MRYVPSATRAVSLLLSVFLLGCSGGGDGSIDPPPLPTPVASVTLEGPSDALLLGRTATLTAVARDAAGNPLDRPFVWQSSSPEVATVSGGVVTPVGVGRTTISAIAEGKRAESVLPVVFASGTADFGNVVTGQKSMSGILLGTRSGIPAVELVTPLQPRLWRDRDVSNYARVTAAGARYMFLSSDHWGYPLDNWPRGRPWVDTIAYKQFIRTLAEDKRGLSLIWDVWNEPDTYFGPNFWDGTEQQFFETYLRTYRVLREVLGADVPIAGPSISRYDLGMLTRFADFCLANGCEVNVITWHEMGADRPLSSISAHLQTVRQNILSNPKYTPLKMREIHINEIVGPQETQNPAAILTYFQFLELGGADAAARACWPEPRVESSCENNTLGGLLTPDFRRRASWWAYALYASGVASRVAGRSTDERLAVLPSRTTGANQAQILVGYSSVDITAAPAQTWLEIRLERLSTLPFTIGSRVRIAVQKVPSTGFAELALLTPVTTHDVDVVNGTVHVVIEGAERDALYQLLVTPVP